MNTKNIFLETVLLKKKMPLTKGHDFYDNCFQTWVASICENAYCIPKFVEKEECVPQTPTTSEEESLEKS